MGDWEVGRSDEQDTRLRVRPGYGDIRKISFLCPDYAAILSYSLSLGPSHHLFFSKVHLFCEVYHLFSPRFSI